MKLLITGATGKVGQNLLPKLLASRTSGDFEVVALCNNRTIEANEQVKVVQGSLSNHATIRAAMAGVTHVLHMAAVKESPDLVIDVAIKGMFLLLEEFRQSADADQFILIGGDCSVGHIFHQYPAPISENAPRMAYQGCYALTKVIEEVMLEQYQIQYGLNGCTLRAPWIMEKDDFKYALSFGPDQFGGPAWDELMDAKALELSRSGDFVPLMHDAEGRALLRNFVHVDDLVAAILAALGNPAAKSQLFNIAMNEPVSYAEAADYLGRSRGYAAVDIPTPFHSNWLDNAKAKLLLGWRPMVDLETLIERAWSYERAPNDPRKIWYPG